jgi:hypothetical protein
MCVCVCVCVRARVCVCAPTSRPRTDPLQTDWKYSIGHDTLHWLCITCMLACYVVSRGNDTHIGFSTNMLHTSSRLIARGLIRLLHACTVIEHVKSTLQIQLVMNRGMFPHNLEIIR